MNNVKVLADALNVYGKGSSAKVNWNESEVLWAGQNLGFFLLLPGNLSWGSEGLNILGIHFGTKDFQKLNWEGLEEKVFTRLSKWNWLLPQLSYRGRVLITNNLAASILWHRFSVLQPPAGLVQAIQRHLISFFLFRTTLGAFCNTVSSKRRWGKIVVF